MSAERIDEVLSAVRADGIVLERWGHADEAKQLRALCDRMEAAAAPFMTWLSERDAQLRSGHGVPWLRERFKSWERQGLARANPRNRSERQYLEVAVPLREDQERIDAIRERARHLARGEMP